MSPLVLKALQTTEQRVTTKSQGNIFKERTPTMKIKLFTREHVSDGIHEKFGFEKFRIENDVEFETRINDFMIDKNVVSVQSLKDSVFVTYTD